MTDKTNDNMMDDLEKLALELQNMQPSPEARTRGMDAAMTAFDTEFRASSENISTSTQGLELDPRPTEHSTDTGSAQAFGSGIMSTFNNLFTFKPATQMMMGSCAAAMLAALVIMPNIGVLDGSKSPDIAPIATEVTSGDVPQTADSNQEFIASGTRIDGDVEPVPTSKLGITDQNIEKTPDIDDTIIVTASRIEKAPSNVEMPVTAITQEELGNADQGTVADKLQALPSSAEPSPAPAPASSLTQGGLDTAISAAKNSVNMPSLQPAPKTEDNRGDVTSIQSILDKVRQDAANVSPENRERAEQFRNRKSQGPALVSNRRDELRKMGIEVKTDPNATPIEQYRQMLQAGNNVNRFTNDIIAKELASNTIQLADGLILEEVPAEYKTETKKIVTKEVTSEIVMPPPVFDIITETVVVQPESIEYIKEPTEYKWVDGEIEGGTVEYDKVPAEYETFTETVVVQEASTELVTIPPVYNPDGSVAVPAQVQERVAPSIAKTETRRRVKTPARSVERFVPYVTKDGKTRIPVGQPKTIEKRIPAVTKQVERRVVKTPASVQERLIPPGTEIEAQVRTQIAPQRFYLRDETGAIIKEFANRDEFENYIPSNIKSVSEDPVSTFSVDVDTASYSFLRATINNGQLPKPKTIRLEEMINYFPYDYQAPTSADEPFKANVTVTTTPWNTDTKLMHIGIKGYTPPLDERPDSNIVFLIDTSGSMNSSNKLPLLINSFKLLLTTLDEDDTVSIVTYAGRAGTVLEPTSASDKATINDALSRLRAGGSTAGAAGLELAYQKAQENFDDDAVNRVILATDGDFNVGFSSPDEMKAFIEEKRKTGIFLSVLGFGMGNYNDHLMQSLAQNGNGVAAYIDSLAEAQKVLANEAGSALFTIAKDVKIQVEFNPATIAEYRLLGYETRALKRQDFNNDKVDAGEINAGHTVTAIYELTPVGSPAQQIDDLRYAKADTQDVINGSDEFAFVKIRHKKPDSDTSELQNFPVGPRSERKLRRTSDDMRFATAVAAVGQKLRGDAHLIGYSYEDAITLANSAKGDDENGYRAEFVQMVKLIDSLSE